MTLVQADDLPALMALLQRGQVEIESGIRGESMAPTLKTGDRIRITCGDVSGCSEGDVLAFVYQGGLVAHRMVARGQRGPARQYVVTRGDGMHLCDPPVPLASVLGRVTSWSPSDTDSWRDLPSAPTPGIGRRAGERLVATLLELHPGFARASTGRLLWVRGKLLRLRHHLS